MPHSKAKSVAPGHDAEIDLQLADVLAVGSSIPFPHASRPLAQADRFMVLAWLGNTKLPNWHRNVDCDELWIHCSGPPLTVETGPGNSVVLSEGELVLIPRGMLHTSDAPASPPAVIAIAEHRITDYARRPIEIVDSPSHPISPVSWKDEIGRYTPPWRYPQVQLASADAFVVEVMARAEGSLKPRGTSPFDEVWFVMKGRVQFEIEREGEGPIVSEGWVATLPANHLYRPVALEAWTAALLLRGKPNS